MANSPGTARLGRRLLEGAAASNTPANARRTVSVTESEPIPLDDADADAFAVHVNGYGGAPSGALPGACGAPRQHRPDAGEDAGHRP